MNIPYTVFDLETKLWSGDFDCDPKEAFAKYAEKFGLSCAVTWSQEDGYIHYFENDAQDLIDYLCNSAVVVGFNVKNFDYRVLSPYGDFNPNKIPTFDILQEIVSTLGNYVKLSMMIKANFDGGRVGSPAKAVDWYKKGLTTKVKDYCENDVKITNLLFEKAINEKQLKWHWHNLPDVVKVMDTSHWEKKVENLANHHIPDELLEIGLSVEMRLRMKQLEPDGSMSHEQDRAVVGLTQNIEQICETLKSMGSPVDVHDVQFFLKKGYRKKGVQVDVTKT